MVWMHSTGVLYNDIMVSTLENCSANEIYVSYYLIKNHVLDCTYLKFLTTDGRKSISYRLHLFKVTTIFSSVKYHSQLLKTILNAKNIAVILLYYNI